MAFSEFELTYIDKTVGALCRRKTTPRHADQLRFAYQVDAHGVNIWEERPPWDGQGEWTRHGIARFRYVRKTGDWTLYWMRADLKWHVYDPDLMPHDLESLVAVVDQDKYCAFFG